MNDLHQINELNLNNIVFVGMGNRIKGDDGVGIYISQELEKWGNLKVITAENSIENYLGKINKQNVDSIIFIDAVDFGEKPGFSRFITVNKLTNTTTNTHNLSLSTISQLLDAPFKWVVGVQAADVGYGIGLSPQIKNTADSIIEIIRKNSFANSKIT